MHHPSHHPNDFRSRNNAQQLRRELKWLPAGHAKLACLDAQIFIRLHTSDSGTLAVNRTINKMRQEELLGKNPIEVLLAFLHSPRINQSCSNKSSYSNNEDIIDGLLFPDLKKRRRIYLGF
ncbi:hypothetical protein VP01_108g7 [Puccinia sorghi]|uniref:Uncharacterized protein n=1 Tax=Puccinia sorghi TaxID=27349 RepID=A0A0L6VUI4_9BASI|nr:hypothetical protein VP01_108g7 [Puccinia sorghi]